MCFNMSIRRTVVKFTLMNVRIWSLVLVVGTLLGACSRTEVEPPPEPDPIVEPEPEPEVGQGVPIVLDTDLGIDVDDAGALAVLHALADRGEADILATVANVYDPYAVAAIDAVNTYYNRPDIPTGRNPNPAHYAVATPYWRPEIPHFVATMAEFPNDTDLDALTPAVSVYRQSLAAQPDGSVTVVSLGFMQNLADLMDSAPDEYSDLGGMDLIRQKVEKLVVMGGVYPGHRGELYLSGGQEMDAAAAKQVVDNWPTTTVFSPGNADVCDSLLNGGTLSEETPETNPVREGYALFNGPERGRASWDLCAVLYAVRGLADPEDGAYFKLAETEERLTVTPEGASRWVESENSPHERMLRVMAVEELENILEALLVAPPGESSE